MSARTLVLTRLQQLGVLGKLHAYERNCKTPKDFAQVYSQSSVLAGGFLRRTAAAVLARGSMGNGRREQYDLVIFRGWEDAVQSQLTFDQHIDVLMDEFANNHRVGDWTSVDGERIGFELQRNEPAMFAGVLVHYAVLRITLIK